MFNISIHQYTYPRAKAGGLREGERYYSFWNLDLQFIINTRVMFGPDMKIRIRFVPPGKCLMPLPLHVQIVPYMYTHTYID